jgi:hypothetical protein
LLIPKQYLHTRIYCTVPMATKLTTNGTRVVNDGLQKDRICNTNDSCMTNTKIMVSIRNKTFQCLLHCVKK